MIWLLIQDGFSEPKEFAQELGVPIKEIYNAVKKLRRLLKDLKE